jgi:hypothetical protein
MSGTPCDVYDGSGLSWPRQCFPAVSFLRRYTMSDLREARSAWDLFEKVEAADAATRVEYSGTGILPQPAACSKSIWCTFEREQDRIKYHRGQHLHAELCPEYSWVPQRTLGISPTPLTSVYPQKLM